MLIPYLGNKERFRDFINPNIPNDISNYIEPFGGAMGVYLQLDLEKFSGVKFIYNDINYFNSNLFSILKEDGDQFINWIKNVVVDKEIYLEALNSIKSPTNNSKLDAKNWLIVLTCSSPKKVGVDSWIGSTEFEVFKLKWRAYRSHLKNLFSVYNKDWSDIIDQFDSYSTFFYLDPPYMSKENFYINSDFIEESHVKLANKLNNIKGRFLLSYYYFKEMDHLYPNCRFESKSTIMGTEWIIMNY